MSLNVGMGFKGSLQLCFFEECYPEPSVGVGNEVCGGREAHQLPSERIAAPIRFSSGFL